MKEVEKTFTALKADAMLTGLSAKEQQKRLHELTQQEKQTKEEMTKDCQELQLILKEARDCAKMLDIDMGKVLPLLCYRELKRIHWHIDQMNK